MLLEANDPEDKLSGRVRACIHEDFVVTLSWIGPSDALQAASDAETFFDTFRSQADQLQKATSGKTVQQPAMAPTDPSGNQTRPLSKPGQKLTPEVIKRLLAAPSDVDFLMNLGAVEMENLDADTITFAIELWLTAKDLSQVTMIANAYSDATMSVLGLHDAIADHSVTNWFRRLRIRRFLADHYNEQIRDLREVTEFEIRMKAIVSKIGAPAAPELASRQQWSMLDRIGDAAVKTLKKAAEDKNSPHRLASYFALRHRFANAEVTPLPIAELMEMARSFSVPSRNHLYREHAIEEIKRLGHAATLIDEYVQTKLRRGAREYEPGFVEECRSEIQEHEQRYQTCQREKSFVQAGIAKSSQAECHHALYNYFVAQQDRANAGNEFNLANRAFKDAEEVLSHDTSDKFDGEQLPSFREINARRFGLFYQSCQMHDKAIEKFRLALAAKPLSSDAAEGIAVSLMQMKQYRAAVEQYDEAIRREREQFDPRHSSERYYYQRLSELYCAQLDAARKLGDPEEIRYVESRIVECLKNL